MRAITRRSLLVSLIFAMIPLLATCSGSGGGGADSGTGHPPDEYAAELFPTTKVVDDAVLSKLADVADDGTFRFTGVPSALQQIAADDVIIGGISARTPYGFLRYVTGVETSPQGDLLLHTIPAPVQLGFRKLHAKFTRSVPDIGAAAAGKPVLGQAIGIWPPAVSVNYYPFNGDKDPLSPDDQVHVTGTLSGGVDYFFGIDVDWGAVANIPAAVQQCAQKLFIGCDPIPEAIVDFGISGGVKADLTTNGVSFLSYTKNIPLYGPVYFEPIPIGLLWFFPEFEISSQIKGQASSQFAMGLSMEGDAGVGVSISSKKLVPDLSPPPYASISLSAPSVDATLDAYTKVRVGPQISLKLYGFAGPRAGLFGFAELAASKANIEKGLPCYSLKGGVEGELGFTIGVNFSILGSYTLANWQLTNSLWAQEVKSGDCTGGGTSPPNPLLNPAFTPWAMAFGGTVEPAGLPYSAPGGRLGGTDLQPTVDGRFAVAGTGNRGLLKIDNDGQPVWAKRFIGPTLGDPFITGLLPDHVAPTEDAAMFVTAYPWAVLKVDAGGDLVWAKQFALTPNDDWWRISGLAADGSGGMYLTASYGTNASVPLDTDAIVARLDSGGGILWLRRIGDSGVAEVPRIAVPFGGGIAVAGTRCVLNLSGLCGGWTLWVIDLDSSGAVLWSRMYPLAAGSVSPLTGHEAGSGDLIIGGTIDASPQRSFFAKIKPDGSMAFLTAYKASASLNLEDLSLTSLVPLPTTGYIATGTHTPYPYSLGRDLWVASLDGIGQVQWIEKMKTPEQMPPVVPPQGGEELMPAIRYTTDGGALVAGYTEDLAGGSAGTFLFKTFAKDGTITFAAAGGVTAAPLAVINDTSVFCTSQCAGLGSAWTPLVQDLVVSLASATVTVQDVTVTKTQLGP